MLIDAAKKDAADEHAMRRLGRLASAKTGRMMRNRLKFNHKRQQRSEQGEANEESVERATRSTEMLREKESFRRATRVDQTSQASCRTTHETENKQTGRDPSRSAESFECSDLGLEMGLYNPDPNPGGLLHNPKSNPIPNPMSQKNDKFQNGSKIAQKCKRHTTTPELQRKRDGMREEGHLPSRGPNDR